MIDDRLGVEEEVGEIASAQRKLILDSRFRGNDPSTLNPVELPHFALASSVGLRDGQARKL